MNTVWSFLVKFASLIVCKLDCFDRMIFKGHLPLSSAKELERFVDSVLKIRRKDFLKQHAPRYSEQLVEHANRWARRIGRVCLYRTGKFRKYEWAQELIRAHAIS